MPTDIPPEGLFIVLYLAGLIAFVVVVIRWRRRLGLWPLPPGCVCPHDEWDDGPIDPVCGAFVRGETLGCEQWCDRCDHYGACHAD